LRQFKTPYQSLADPDTILALKRLLSPFTEDELVARLREQDETGFRYLYDHYSPALFGIICRIVQDEEQAQDVLQEVFVKIWRNIRHYDSQKGRLFTWMLNIARNTSIDTLRTARDTQSIQSDSSIVYTIDQQQATLQPKADYLDVPDKVNQLKPERQEVIDLVYFKGYTHEEAAERLNLPLGTVKTRVRAALQDLKKLFKP